MHVKTDRSRMTALLLALISASVILNSRLAFSADIQDIDYIRSIMSKVLNGPVSMDEAPTQAATVSELKIVQFLSAKESTVIINGGRQLGIVDGAIIYSYRPRKSPVNPQETVWVKTGKLKAVHVDETFTLASVVSQGDELTKAFFENSPFPMAGDRVSEARFRVVKNPILTPTNTLLYADIFMDPKADPTTFELTEEGKAAIRANVEIYKKLFVPVLMVEGYTDPNGPADANQVESYQRAFTVRQFLIDQLGFAPSRVVAIGYGESQLVDSSNVVGSRENNRRISFKVNVNANASH